MHQTITDIGASSKCTEPKLVKAYPNHPPLPPAPSPMLRSQKLKKSQSLTKSIFSQSSPKQITQASRRKSENLSDSSGIAHWKPLNREKGVGKISNKDLSVPEKQHSVENRITRALLQASSYKSVPVKEMSFQGPFQLVHLISKEKEHCPDCQIEPSKSIFPSNGVKLDPLGTEPEHSSESLKSTQVNLVRQGVVSGKFSGSGLKATVKKQVKQTPSPSLEGVHLTLDTFQAQQEEDPGPSCRQLQKSISVPPSASTSFQNTPYRSGDWRTFATPGGKFEETATLITYAFCAPWQSVWKELHHDVAP